MKKNPMTEDSKYSFPAPQVAVMPRGITSLAHVSTLESTQDAAKEAAVAGASHGLLVVADEQTRGRGQFERQWASAPGGLYMSVVLRPGAKPHSLSALSLATARALSGTLSSLYSIKSRIKEPNDVLALEPKSGKYLKIAGILIESSSSMTKTDWAVAGIGVNLNNRLPAGLEAVYVARITGAPVSRDEFLEAFFRIFWDRYAEWESSLHPQGK